MKIAIDLTALAFNFSGIERYAFNITREIIRQNKKHEIELFFCNAIYPDLKELVDSNPLVNAVCIQSSNGKFGKLYTFQRKLPKALKGVNADCYFFPAFAPPIFFHEHNMIDTMHDIGYFDCPSMWKWYVTLYGKLKLLAALRHCNNVVTVSEYTKKRIIERFGVNENRIRVSKNATDERFCKTEISEENCKRLRNKYCLPDKPFILCLATLEPRKNLPLLVNAYIELREKNKIQSHLVLAGRKGWKIDDMLAKVNDKYKEDITVTGFVDDSDLPFIYSMADLFVFPSVYEGFGIPPLEALACGTQVLVSDIPVFKEEYGEAANYFENNNLIDLEDKLVNYRNVDESVRENTIANYGWGKSASVYMNLFDSINNA